MGPAFLVFIGIALLVGFPLAATAIGLGWWMRRAQKHAAFSTWIGASLSGAFAYFAGLGAVAQLIRIAVHEERNPGYYDTHPARPLIMIALGLVALFAAFVCAVFCIWTLARLVQAPPAQPLRTTPAT